MKNPMQQMLKQAQAMQEKMMQAQQQLEEMEVEGTAGGGMVTVTLNGKNDLKGVKIDASLLNPAEGETLEDLLIAAHNNARKKIEEETSRKLSSVTGGMQLPPGFNLPF